MEINSGSRMEGNSSTCVEENPSACLGKGLGTQTSTWTRLGLIHFAHYLQLDKSFGALVTQSHNRSLESYQCPLHSIPGT